VTQSRRPTVLIFGASGTIGAAISAWFSRDDWHVIGASRSGGAIDCIDQTLAWTVDEPADVFDAIEANRLDAVVWAQGMNLADTCRNFDKVKHRAVYDANVVYILESLQILLDRGLIGSGSRLCVISSIWQDIARQGKLSYCVSKSALSGLVRSVAADLGADGVMINAVLPGPLDTPMTRNNLEPKQLDAIVAATPLKSLPTIGDVCATVGFLCSSANSGLTGQFVAADRGYSHVRTV
jgi:NAD(P)-dependent dehydrogenase (short-subunit alcohol dehydrogenase family)